MASVNNQGALDLDVNRRAVELEKPGLDCRHDYGRVGQTLHVRQLLFKKVGVNQIGNRLVQQILRLARTEQFDRGRIDIQNLVGTVHDDGLGRPLDQRAVAFLTRAQGRHGALALGLARETVQRVADVVGHLQQQAAHGFVKCVSLLRIQTEDGHDIAFELQRQRRRGTPAEGRSALVPRRHTEVVLKILNPDGLAFANGDAGRAAPVRVAAIA